MKPDLRDPRLLLAWALGQFEDAVRRSVSGNFRVHFEAGRITRAETVQQQMPGDAEPAGDVPDRAVSAWVAKMLEREQREQTYGVVEFRLEWGALTLARTERCEKPPRHSVERVRAVQ